VTAAGREESWVVVVVDEVAGDSDVRPGGGGTIIVVLETGHGSTRLEGVSECGIEGVVEDRVKGSLVACDVRKVITEDFTNGVDTSCPAELSPEVFSNIGDGINSKSIKVVSLDKISDPLKESLLDKWVILVKIRESTQPASFHAELILGIDVSAVRVLVIVASIIEGNNGGVVPVVDVSNVVSNDINHNPDVSFMADSDEFFKFLSGAKLFIDLIEVADPVAVVSSFSVSYDWGDPDSIEAHILNVVQVVLDALESSSTVVTEVVAWSGATVSSGESVSDDLINGARSPFFSCLGEGNGDEKRKNDKSRKGKSHSRRAKEKR